MRDVEEGGSLRQERLDGARMSMEVDLSSGCPGEGVERVVLLGRQAPRPHVPNAQRAKGLAVGRQEGRAGEEAQMRGAGHERVIGEAGIG